MSFDHITTSINYRLRRFMSYEYDVRDLIYYMVLFHDPQRNPLSTKGACHLADSARLIN
jgi:hypothetical protein